MDYFRETSAAPSEKPLNLLAIALNVAIKANPRVESSPLFKSAAARYEQLNAQLEASRPGYKRWGTQWISPEEYQQKKRARDEAQRAYEKSLKEIEQCAKDVDYATAEIARVRASMSNFTYHTTAQSEALQSAQSALQFAVERLGRQKTEADKARRAIPAINWPDSMEPVEPP
jgi:chromosome segregation ATPase